MSIATVVCGIWSLTRIFNVILAGGVGKNGSTVAVSLLRHQQNLQNNKTIINLFFLYCSIIKLFTRQWPWKIVNLIILDFTWNLFLWRFLDWSNWKCAQFYWTFRKKKKKTSKEIVEEEEESMLESKMNFPKFQKRIEKLLDIIH